MKCVYIILLTFVSTVSGMMSSKSIEGYSAGYLSDCPGFDYEVAIKPKSLRYLALIVMGDVEGFKIKKRRYDYYQMDKLINDPDLDMRKKTVIYAGGYMDSPHTVPPLIIGQIYKNLGYNVLILDYFRFTFMEYPLAVRYTRAAAKRVGEMLANLTAAGLDPKTIEMIGISLGGQTISYIAKQYKNITGEKISRITALDPAGPCFRNLGPHQRIDDSDADFVDVLLTNIDGFGMAAPVGHVNFYVNGGEYQPGDLLWLPCNILCSHVRSYTLWISALLNPKSFLAIKCDTVQDARDRNCYDRMPQETNVLGLYTDRKKPGIYYLTTHNNFPYYLREKGLRKEYEYFSSHMKELIDKGPMAI